MSALSVFMEPGGVAAAAAATAALSAQAAGHTAQAAAAAAVVPPGLDEISAANVAKIGSISADIAAVLAAAAGQQSLYGLANGAASVVTTVADEAAGAVINAVI